MNNNILEKIEKSYPVYKIVGNEKQKTLYFKIGKKDILPGQFFMLNYNISQKPISVSYYDNEIIGFTIEDRGETSGKMINSKIGEFFGLIGPLGNPFEISDYKNILIIGGGIGVAPLYFLLNYILKYKKKVHAFFGAKSKSNLDFVEKFKTNKDCLLNLYTEDGSLGDKGFVTKDLNKYIDKYKYDSICICGPEIMMNIVINKIKRKISNIQVCMERYMKCGLGICGTCVLDDTGERVCVEGPVFQYNSSLKKCKEFGNYHRNSNGIIEKF